MAIRNTGKGLFGSSLTEAMKAAKQDFATDKFMLERDMGQMQQQYGALGQAQKPSPPVDPNIIPALQAPLSVLRDMWAAKWGDLWVLHKEVAADEFWKPGYARLASNGALESLDMPDGYKWYRLRERQD